MLKPLNSHILIDLVEEKGTMVLPDAIKKYDRAKVIAIADEVTLVKEGDTIYVEDFYPKKIESEGRELYFVKEEEVVAKE